MSKMSTAPGPLPNLIRSTAGAVPVYNDKGKHSLYLFLYLK